MVWALHGIMTVGASITLFCALGRRPSFSGIAVVSSLVMLAAMMDSVFGTFGLGPLPWAAILIVWGLACSALLRRRAARELAAPSDELAPGPARRGLTMRLHHPLGLVVTAGQLTAHAVISPGAGSGIGIGASFGSGHAHSPSLLLPLVGVAGAAFVGWSLALLVTETRGRLERGSLVGMSAMTAAMAMMPFA